MTADEEMRAAYGIDKDNECRDCGDRVYSRLMSDRYQVVPVTAEDYRRAK